MSEVISFTSRRPLALEEAETQALIKAEEEARAVRLSEHQGRMIDSLEKILAMARTGRLEGLMVITRDTETKLFVTDLHLDARVVPASESFAWLGAMETLKLEIADVASMSPVLTPDGTVVDPWTDEDDFEEYED